MNEDQYEVTISVPFKSKRIAEIAYDVLRVDKEPKRSGVTKILRVEDNILFAEFSAKLARQLRVSTNGFFDKIDLIIRTIELLGSPVSEEYSHY